MAKDRKSAAITKSEVPPASQRLSGDDLTQKVNESLKRLQGYAKPRGLAILSADEGKELIRLLEKSGQRIQVRVMKTNTGVDGLVVKVFSGFDFVAEV